MMQVKRAAEWAGNCPGQIKTFVLLLFCFAFLIISSSRTLNLVASGIYSQSLFSLDNGLLVDTASGWKTRYNIMCNMQLNQMNYKENTTSHQYQRNWEPTVSCGLEERIGRRGDGGKWICNPERISAERPIVYSFGSNGDFSFEAAIYDRLGGNVEIHTFDFGEYSGPGYVHYHQWGIGTVDEIRNNRQFVSLPTVLDKLGHTNRNIDIWKMDIEGSEFPIMAEAAKAGHLRSVQQILIETHLNSARVDLYVDMMTSLRNHCNMEIFHKEANLYCASCMEFAFVKVNWAELTRQGVDIGTCSVPSWRAIELL